MYQMVMGNTLFIQNFVDCQWYIFRTIGMLEITYNVFSSVDLQIAQGNSFIACNKYKVST